MDEIYWSELKLFNRKEFIEKLCEVYGMYEESAKKLDEDFELLEKGVDTLDDFYDEVAPFNMREAAEKVGLPVKVIGRLHDCQVISNPMLFLDIHFLTSLKKIWGNPFFIRKQLSNLSYQQRQEIIKRPELTSKWERWAYSTFLNNKIDLDDKRRIMNPENRIRIEMVAEILEDVFKVPNNEKLKTRLRKIREIAWNDKKRAKKEGIEVDQMALRRDIDPNYERQSVKKDSGST